MSIFVTKERTTERGKAYEQYINSDEWAKKRSQYWKKYGRSCKVEGCEETKNLHVHHITYKRLGAEWMTDLIGVCEKHHYEIHQKHNSTWKNGRRSSLRMVTNSVLGYRAPQRGVSSKAKAPKIKKEKLSNKYFMNENSWQRMTLPGRTCPCRSMIKVNEHAFTAHKANSTKEVYFHARCVDLVVS